MNDFAQIIADERKASLDKISLALLELVELRGAELDPYLTTGAVEDKLLPLPGPRSR